MIRQILFIVLFFFFISSTHAQNKKNICAITISSSNEINTFKRLLNPKEFDFVELTLMGDEFNWFENSCRSGVKCDVLVISGHFAGNFFSLENPFLIMSSDEMEKKSCANTCSGILKSPIETYLFGCNTLAIKNQQTRTREQYRQALLADQMHPALIDQAIATVFSPIGNAYFSRMRKIFYNTPIIYGFSDKGPLGKNVEGYLKNYLSQIKDYNQHLDKLKSYQGTKISDADLKQFSALWNKTMANTAKATASGFGTGAKKECGLFSDDLYLQDKFKIVNDLFSELDVSEYLMPIQNFLNKVDTNDFYDIERVEFNKIKSNQRVQDMVVGIIHAIEDLHSLRISLLKMALKLEWINSDYFQNELNKTLDHMFKNGVDYDESQIICDAKIIGNVDVNTLKSMPDKNWHSIAALNCLKLNNPDYFNFIQEFAKSKKDQYLDYQVMNLISWTNLSETEVLSYIQEHKKHPFYLVRYFAAMAIGDHRIQSTEAYQLLIDFLKDSDSNVKFAAEVSLQSLKPTEEWVMREIRRLSPHIISW